MTWMNIEYNLKNEYAYVGFGKNTDQKISVLDEQTLTELKEILQQVSQDLVKGVIFHSLKDGVFLAGADINLINKMSTIEEAQAGAATGQDIYNMIEDLKVPTIACVNGVCLGGGLELALSCNKIIASDSPKTSLGLPEVQLGLIPGFGGTYRLPIRIGLPKSLDLILTGKRLNGKRAKKAKLVEEVYAKERLLDMALVQLTKSKKEKSISDSIGDVALDNFLTRKIIFQKAREGVVSKTRGLYEAPLKILDVMSKGAGKNREKYLKLEAQAFGELCMGEQSKNLRHIYFLTESSKKYAGPVSEEEHSLNRGVVLGAGTMGGGIAWLMANNDMRPIMKDLNIEALELGLKQSSAIFKKAVKRKKMNFDQFERKQRSISAQLDNDGFKNADLIIEAVVENMHIKKQVFEDLENVVRENCLVTSNTSSLSVNEMSKALKNSSRFAGLHFFNPVNMMPLVEIITHDNISPRTIKTLYNWCIKVKKTPVIVGDGPGFLVNRILAPYLNEAVYLLEEGVSIEDIDKAGLNFGMPMGSFRLMDEIGIDVGVKVGKILHEGLGDRARPSALSSKLEEQGFLGKKNSKGFYKYNEKGKDEGINDAILKHCPSKNKTLSEREIQNRLILPMINEAATILDDKIVLTSGEVDLGLIYGIGFAPFRGGLLKYADSLGLKQVVELMKPLEDSVDSNRFKACDYLKDLASQNIGFYKK